MSESDPPGPAETDEPERARVEHHSRLVEAAIAAEFETGAYEETLAEAKRHIVYRLARMALGFTVLILGLLAIPLPGPGWLIVALGLGILSRDFAWAERTLDLVRNRLPQDADGRIPTKTWVMIGVATAMTASVSTWWGFFR